MLAGIHLVLTFASGAIAYGSGMEAFDQPDYEPSSIECVADHLSEILIQPGRFLWTQWMSKKLPGIIEWGLCIANSLLWGFAISFLIRGGTLGVKKGQIRKPCR